MFFWNILFRKIDISHFFTDFPHLLPDIRHCVIYFENYRNIIYVNFLSEKGK